MSKLRLFITPVCPFCIRVLNFMKANDYKVDIVDCLKEKEAFDELIEKGGKKQVPCLNIDDTYMYESAKIMDWMSENL